MQYKRKLEEKTEKIGLSILIPVYNVELYLEQCLKSVIINKSDAVEVIIINDASTDQSLKICKNIFLIEDSNIKKFKKNEFDQIESFFDKY